MTESKDSVNGIATQVVAESDQKKDITCQNSPNRKPDTSSIQVQHLTELEIESLRQSKRDAYQQMMALAQSLNKTHRN